MTSLEEDWEEFFRTNPAPADIQETERALREFVHRHHDVGRRPLCLVTSGGTTVPLELNTVRFVDNFSAGTRGSASAEYLLSAGYAVVFLHRDKSLRPFTRHVNTPDLLQAMEMQEDGTIKISASQAESLRPIVERSRRFSDNLLCITFTSLTSYLWLLKLSSQILSSVSSPERRSLLYLAAAVSDFYIPSSELPEHKIQSSEGPPSVRLQLVPKMLKPLVSQWASSCFVVSFKLETDPDMLLSKSRAALEKYGHSLVIGNILTTRKREVVFVDRTSMEKVEMSSAELEAGVEIEEKIVRKLVSLSDRYKS